MAISQSVCVTGSSQGIGYGVAAAFLASGARVVLTGEQALAEVPAVAQLLREYPGQSHYLPVDLLDRAGPEMLLQACWELLGPLDVLVNNVGTFAEPSFLESTSADFSRIFRLNVEVALLLCQGYVRRAGARGGRILFTTSLNATRSEPGHTLYDASKGALNALIRQLAIELAPLNFTTVGIAPGLVETPLTDFGLRSDPHARQTILEQIPLRRIGTVEDVAAWYVFLASPAAAYATGTIITIDGGLDAQQMSQRPLSDKLTP